MNGAGMLRKMRFSLHIAATCSFLAACQTHPAEPIVKTVTVTVPGDLRPCVPEKTPRAEAYADARVAGMPPEDKLQAALVANEQRKKRLDIVEPLLDGCR